MFVTCDKRLIFLPCSELLYTPIRKKDKCVSAKMGKGEYQTISGRNEMLVKLKMCLATLVVKEMQMRGIKGMFFNLFGRDGVYFHTQHW